MSPSTFFDRASQWTTRPAVVDTAGTATYGTLLEDTARAAASLLDGAPDLRESRVAFLVAPGRRYVTTLWAIWRAGGIAVPLSASQALAEWEHVIGDSSAAVVVAEAETAPALRPLAERFGCRLLLADGPSEDAAPDIALPAMEPGRRAMMVYTSGTTSRPKGVVTTHRTIASQVRTLVDAWEWTQDDRVLCVLPLHHVHGIVNIVGCALWSGAVCEFLSPFDAPRVWERFGRGGLTLFMAVPTVYARLAAAWEAAADADRARWSAGARAMRLMVSGSAALPVALLERWRAISGHVLLERYGMTEIGMALSNPLHGERRPGFVGQPLPGVSVRLTDEQGREVAAGTPGEIEVRGDCVFLEYWQRPDATREVFRDGWFRTGDVAVEEQGSYRILGRQSVDIIKSGGYKLSALEIEEAIRQHPAVLDCAVVGVADEEWGERVAVAVVPRAGEGLDLEALRGWGASRLARYKLPTRLVLVGELPRNPMGKVVKARVKGLFSGTSD